MSKTEELAIRLSQTAQTVYADTKTKAGDVYESVKQKLNSAEIPKAEISGNLQNGVDHIIEQASPVYETDSAII